ncbi:aldehyde dehydrogenase family protein, partial [Salmonella enterica subsp. enterica serovar Infantis]
EVTTLLRKRHGQFIAGERQDGHGTNFSVSNTATGKIIDDVVSATPAQAEQAMQSARRAFDVWRKKPTLQRGALMLKLA